MKKLFLATVCALGLSLTANAETFEKGYHGFADLGYTFGIGSNMKLSSTEFMTSHGYQFNKYFFLGVGMGFQFSGEATFGEVGNHAYEKRDGKVDIPIFFNGRVNFCKSKVAPLFDLKVGAYVNNGSGSYINASFGCRFATKANQGIYILAGYEMRQFKYESLKISSGGKYNPYINYSYVEADAESMDGISIKVGYDF